MAPANLQALDSWPVQELEGEIAEHVPPGRWTVVGLRQTQGSLELTLHPVEVTNKPEQEVSVVPRWFAVPR